MMNTKFTVLFFSIFMIFFSLSCRDESVVDIFKSTRYFYSEDKSKILFDETESKLKQVISHNYKEVEADAETFEVLTSCFGKDKESVIYRERKIGNADVTTFYWDSSVSLPKDKNHVYLAETNNNELVVSN